MAWQLFRVTYEVRSPLHIGYHKVGNVQRTRYYIPARNMWAAVTEKLTRSGFSPVNGARGNYRRVGDWLKEHCAFSYLFLCDGPAKIFYPNYTKDGLRYGPSSNHNLDETELERQFISAHVTTALNASTTSAEDESLHEVEYIAPYDSTGHRTQLTGWVWLDEEGMRRLDDEKWHILLGDLSIGGERRCGFGHLRLTDNNDKDDLIKGYKPIFDERRPQIEVQKDSPLLLLAHALTGEIRASGTIELLVGRETRGDSQSFGRRLTKAKICWAPGSVIPEPATFELDESGLWKIGVLTTNRLR